MPNEREPSQPEPPAATGATEGAIPLASTDGSTTREGAPTLGVAEPTPPEPAVIEEDEEEEAAAGPTPAEQAELARLCREIEARCGAGGLKCESVTTSDGRSGLRVLLKAGRDHRAVQALTIDAATKLLRLPFEKLVVLPPYVAVCSYETQTIVALVTAVSLIGFRPLPRPWQPRDDDPEAGHGPYARYESTVDGVPRAIEVGPCPDELALVESRPYRIGRLPAIRLSGFAFGTFDRAKQILEEVSDSLFFDVDLKTGSALALARDIGLPRSRTIARLRWSKDRNADIAFPRATYDHEPMSLYWYARQARGVPLLEFLAYYQCIEFYFPTYAEAEAQKRVRNTLKDPAFDPSKDADIARVVRILSARRGLSEERAQLKATVAACVDPERLRDLFADEDQIEFFSKKKDLGVKSLPLGRTDADLGEAVAERIYEIRCKIVHTKGGDDTDLLLPFSKEAELLGWDIEVIRFVARSVLIASSRFS